MMTYYKHVRNFKHSEIKSKKLINKRLERFYQRRRDQAGNLKLKSKEEIKEKENTRKEKAHLQEKDEVKKKKFKQDTSQDETICPLRKRMKELRLA
ncbi:hypothetical protein Tco_0194934 [Tanacetum coccineum]